MHFLIFISLGVAGAAIERPLEGVASNVVRARGRLSPTSLKITPKTLPCSTAM